MSKEEAIKWLINLRTDIGRSEHQALWHYEQALSDIMELLNAPTIEPKWIPCEERLPERQGYYICTCKDGSRYKRTTTIKWSNGWQLSGARAYWIVIAWMPLPEPYEGSDLLGVGGSGRK